jgi:hypothetical protein
MARAGFGGRLGRLLRTLVHPAGRGARPVRSLERGPAAGDRIDRPVLVIGRRGGDLLALMLTSKDHDRDAADEARFGRYWTDIGRGPWDARGRPSEVRLDRLLVLDPAGVRREGAALDRVRFDRVVAEARRVQGW